MPTDGEQVIQQCGLCGHSTKVVVEGRLYALVPGVEDDPLRCRCGAVYSREDGVNAWIERNMAASVVAERGVM